MILSPVILLFPIMTFITIDVLHSLHICLLASLLRVTRCFSWNLPHYLTIRGRLVNVCWLSKSQLNRALYLSLLWDEHKAQDARKMDLFKHPCHSIFRRMKEWSTFKVAFYFVEGWFSELNPPKIFEEKKVLRYLWPVVIWEFGWRVRKQDIGLQESVVHTTWKHVSGPCVLDEIDQIFLGFEPPFKNGPTGPWFISGGLVWREVKRSTTSFGSGEYHNCQLLEEFLTPISVSIFWNFWLR